MRIHTFQHIEFEGLGDITTWADAKHYGITKTKIFQGQPMPALDKFDWLFVMGGPMSVYEEDKYPWLHAEKEYVEKAISAGKVVVGICLGAQLLADVLGAKVYPNSEKEIGWFPVSLTEQGKNCSVFSVLPHRFTCLHWHGDTFELPSSSLHLAQSEGCANQAFSYGDNVYALQFHLELTRKRVGMIIDNCRHELVPGRRFIQQGEEILSKEDNFSQNAKLLFNLLDTIEAKFKSQSKATNLV